MHTRHSVRWLTSVAALSAGVVGILVPLAAPASAAAGESISISPEQPRYPVSFTGVVDATITNAPAGAQPSLTVTNGPDSGNLPAACTLVTGTLWHCPLKNGGNTGTDSVVVTDAAVAPTSQSQVASVAFETINAAPLQAIYGTGDTATISVQVTGASTGNIKGVVSAGSADAPGVSATPITCSQVNNTGSYTCTYTNNGTAGVDTVTIFDDDDPSGTPGLPDSPSEAQSKPLTINFEKVSVTPSAARSQANQDTFDVAVSGVATGHTPAIKEIVTSGQDSAAPGCTAFAPNAGDPTQGTSTCTINNNGRADSPTIQVFDDLNGDGIPQATEPSGSATFAFETLTATDANPPHAPGSTATINVTVTGAPPGETPSIDYTVAGVDAPATPPASANLCTGSAANWTCSITNNGTVGSDTLTIFDDANDNRKMDAGEPSTTITVTFGGGITVTPASGTFATGGTATFTASVVAPANETPNLTYAVPANSGPDSGLTGPCTPQNGGTSTWSCSVKNGGTAGLDTIVITDTASAQNPKPSATVKATFQSASGVTLTPTLATGQAKPEVAVNGCQAYTVNVTPALSFPITITASEPDTGGSGGVLGLGGTAPGPVLGVCSVPNGNSVTVASNTVAAKTGLLTPTTYTNTMTLNGSTGQNSANPGQLVFGISSTQAGTVTISAASGAVTSGSQSLTVSAGGQTAVHTLTANPTTQATTTGGSATFSVLAQSSDGTPLPGITVDYVIASGGPDATTAPVACPTTDQFGTTKCVVNTGSTTGTDNLTFFAPQTSGEKAPASTDPQTTAKLTVAAAPPPGSHLSLACPDELLTDANALVASCTVTTGNGGQQSVIFAAHVSNASGAALANIPVTFSVVNAPATATSTTGNVTTNTSGNALFVVSENNPAAGDKFTVQATVGNPSAGGLGPAVATATFQTPKPTYLSASPATQHRANGGTATVTGKVLDQFGVGVAGQVLNYTVSGVNSATGTATTNGNGTATINYPDVNGAGTDTVTVTDTSPDAPATGNPATATVVFGAGGGGCTSNCGGGGPTGVEHPSLTVRQRPQGNGARVALIVSSRPRLANTKVTFYQIKGGVRHVIGTGRTGGRGNVTGTLHARAGQHLKFQAKVAGKGRVAGGFSRVVRITVR